VRSGAELRVRGYAAALLRRRPSPVLAAATLAVGGGAAALALAIEATGASDARMAWLHAGGALGALFLATLGGLGLAAAVTRARARTSAADAPRAGATRARFGDAARLAGGLLLLASAFALLIDGAAATLGIDEATASRRPAPEGGLDPRELSGPDAGRGRPEPPRLVDPNGRAGGALPSNLLSTAPVLEVRHLSGPIDPSSGAIHLRGFVLEGFDDGGAPTTAPRAPEPAEIEPWNDIPSAVVDPFGEALGPAAPIELLLTPLAEGDGTVFAPAPLVAVDAERATVEERRALLRTAPGRPTTTHSGVESAAGLATAAARGSVPPDSPWLALPPAAPGSSREADLARIAGFGREAAGRAAGAGPDLARVLGVVGRLRRDFGYDLVDTSFPTPRGCVALLERRTGSCTHFATTAMLALRSMGIPCRVAAGYIARESTGDGAWLVRARDGHAWLEVHFEGSGWWTFDPTPPASGVANPAWTPLEIAGARPRGLAGLVRRLAEDAARWIGGPRSVVALALLVVGVVLALALGLLRRRRGDGGDRAAGRSTPRAPVRAGAGERLAAALRAHGLAQGSHEPPIAFARRADAALAAADPAPGGGAVEASVVALLRCDAHGIDLASDAASRIESLSDALLRIGPR